MKILVQRSLRLAVIVGCWVSMLCFAQESQWDPREQVEQLKRVSEMFAKLMRCNRLPDLSPQEHGKLAGFPLDESFEREHSETSVLTKEMLRSVGDTRNCFIFLLEPSEQTNRGRRNYFMRLNPDRSITLVSAFHLINDQWVKLDTSKAASMTPADLDAECQGLEKVIATFRDAVKRGQVPGLAGTNSGKPVAYKLTGELKKDWIKQDRITKAMLLEISGCESLYLCTLQIGSADFLCFFCMGKDDSVQLLSAYRREGDKWGKLSLNRAKSM